LILIDANLFMYAAGAEHQHEALRVALLERIALGEIEAAVDAEVLLQEILHRYQAIRRWQGGREVYALARRIVPLVVAVTDRIVDRARTCSTATRS
jgi:predicted nucleic acid-binding protein